MPKACNYCFVRNPRPTSRGFTLPEVILTVILTGSLIFATFAIINNFENSEQISDQQLDIIQKADLVLESILSGEKIIDYGLTNFEKASLNTHAGKKVLTIQDIKPELLKWRKDQITKVFDNKIKIDDRVYQIVVTREIFESNPFLLGFEVSVKRNQISSGLSGVVSVFDLRPR